MTPPPSPSSPPSRLPSSPPARAPATVPNSLLSINNSSNKFKPAYLLAGGRLERAGRVKKISSCGQLHVDANGLTSLDLHKNSMLTASIIVVGDEILFDIVEDQLGPCLCRKLHSIGWSVVQLFVVQNNVCMYVRAEMMRENPAILVASTHFRVKSLRSA
ncbi:hypothetical protein RIF29_33172 [Crotalaria pallida]|uniref:Uncharacterized protein n=1 Tax=Crotalaria pallida TaxID=3830 RepID=A0AAN9HQJ6_CROPI